MSPPPTNNSIPFHPFKSWHPETWEASTNPNAYQQSVSKSPKTFFFFFLAQSSHEKTSAGSLVVHKQCRRSQLRWLLILLKGGSSSTAERPPRGRAEWSLVSVQMVLCAGSGTVSVWLRSRGRMLEAATPPTPSFSGSRGRLRNLRGRYSLGVRPWDRSISLRFPESSPEHPSPPQWYLLPCSSTGYRTTGSLMSLCTLPLEAEPLTVYSNRKLKHAWRGLNIDDPPLRIHIDDSQRQAWRAQCARFGHTAGPSRQQRHSLCCAPLVSR